MRVYRANGFVVLEDVGSYLVNRLVANPFSLLIALGGTEITDSRRCVDLLTVERARLQFKASAGITIRVEYSIDDCNNWLTLTSETDFFGGNPFVCDWVVISPTAKMNDVLVRALGIWGGLLTTINYAEMSFD